MLSIFHIKSLILFSCFKENWRKCFSFEEDKQKELQERLAFFERFIARRFWKSPPKPPPTSPLTSFQKFWKSMQWEGILLTREVLSSSAASMVGVFMTQPLEVLKFHYVTSPHVKKKGRLFANGLRILNEVRKLYKIGGISTFYRGHMGMQFESLFQTVSMFYTQQRVYQYLEEEAIGHYPSVCSFISGFLSATIAVLAIKPITAFREQRKLRQMLLDTYGPINAAYQLKQRHSFRRLFKGCFSEFMFLGIQYGIRFWLYNEIRDYILSHKTKKKTEMRQRLDPTANLDHYRLEDTVKNLNYTESLCVGAVSGVIADLISHPFEVIGSRLHMGALERQLYCFEDTCRRYHQCIWLLLRKHKLKGVYTGFTPSLIKSMACVAVQFAAYDKVDQWLEKFFGEKTKKSKFLNESQKSV